jgi:uncharacterized protein (DUF736 family)
MSYEHKANTGTLFPNKKKTAENQPDEKGKIKFGDKEYDLAGWYKEGTNGRFLSLKLSEPFQPTPQSTSEKIMDSTGIPF